MDYQYQSKNERLDFDLAVEILKQRIPNEIEIGGINNFSEDCVRAVLGQLKALSLSVKEIEVDKDEYYEYIAQAGYQSRYPEYYSDNFHEKSLEHFLCYKSLNLQKDQVMVDIASEHSPVPEILSRLTGCRSYAQDIMYQQGVNGNQIGGDAANMPVENEFFDAAIATCSIEHFENGSDVMLIKEMRRVLKRRGKIVIVPLYLYTEPACLTDPTYSVAGDVEFDEDAAVFCTEKWGNRHGRFYSPQSLMDRLIRNNSDISFTIYYIRNTYSISDSVYCRYMLVGEKLG